MWYVDDDGLYNDQFYPIPAYAIECPVSPAIYHIEPIANSGYPYCDLMIGIPKLRLKVVKQNPYISVYEMETPQNGFNNNGSAILCPTECTVHQVENGEWSVRMRHPMDDADKWTYLRERNYLKVLGQLFTIISVETDYTSRMVDVYAEHVFYQLNDAWIHASIGSDTRIISGNNGMEALSDIMVSAAWYSPAPYVVPIYQYYSDIDSCAFIMDVTDGGMTPVQALLGGGGLCELTGGKLFRDNWYFSVNSVTEDSLDNAFDIRIGNNLCGIKRTIDTSNMATLCRVDDGMGDAISCSWGSAWQTMRNLPHNIVRAKRFEMETPTMELLWAKLEAWFWSVCAPIINYEFDIRDSINDELYDDIQTMYRYEVGDRGRLYDDRLGGSQTLTITETEKDGITGRTLRFTVGNTRSFVRSGSAPPADLPAIHMDSKRFVWRDKNGVIISDKNGATLYTEVNYNG